MMIGLSSTDRCGDPTCDVTKEICCPGQQQIPPVLPSSDPGTGGGSAQTVASSSTLTVGSPGGPTVPGFMDGLKAWQSPGTALPLLPHVFSLIQQAPGAAVGLLAPPLAVAVLAFYLIKSRKGR